MKISDEKISHLTHVVLKGLLKKDVIVLSAEEGYIRREIRRVIEMGLEIANEADTLVRRKLQSYSKKIPEGSPEWEVLYQKFFREEMAKKGRI